jgi:NADH-quinone oxidoreductase subunit M
VVGLALPGALSRFTAVAGAAATLVLAVIVLVKFETNAPGLQFVTDETWISELGIHYKLGVDGLNLFLIVLATVLFVASALWSAMRGWDRPGLFFFWLGLAESGVLGALMAQDLALFVIFFDLMLVPFLFLTGSWGGPERIPAIIKLFIYTLVGSLLMLAGAIATGVLAPGGSVTFVLSDLAQRRLPLGSQEWIFLFFAAAFLVKMPAFPLHGWMPDGYRAMPLPVLAVFSGILSKVAAYGFLRVVLPLYPGASVHFQELMLLIALASILYGSAMAFTTTRSRSWASSCSGSSRCGPRARRARSCRRSTTVSSWRRRSSSSRSSRRARADRRTCATWAASRSARPCSRRCSSSSRSRSSRCPARRTSSASS